MIVEILSFARRLDAALGRKFGAPYHALLGIGLGIEIVRRLNEIAELPGATAGALRAGFAVLLYALLLLHQLGELAEHLERRQERLGP